MEVSLPSLIYQPVTATITVMRALGFVVLLYSINRLVPLGTPLFFLDLSAIAGVTLAHLCVRSHLRQLFFYGGAFVTFVLLQLLVYGSTSFKSTLVGHSLGEYSFLLHSNLIIAVFFITCITTWLFWTTRGYATLEAILVLFMALQFFAGHRDFNFQTPKVLGSLAWRLKTSELWALVGLGSALTIFLLSYCFSSKNALLYQLSSRDGLAAVRGGLSERIARLALPLTLFFVLIAGISYAVHALYFEEAQIRLANGVGQKDSEQVSPLSFESAIGASAQPSAIVRLDADYKSNPFIPMLYLREAALSKYDGREMIPAGASFDRDIPNVAPEESFQRSSPVDADTYRTPLRHSVFLLGEHKLAFAVDVPLSINPLKNPKPDRFKAAFKAYSMAPSFPMSSLSDHAVGDPKWSEAERLLYLETHSDPRYKELAKKIADKETNQVKQASALTTYLNKNATYTLQPKHDVEKGGDPTAPFLFGDLRGYCVHFAHATVYMLRALGIPSRVATGYLTDLSQAKDGHILLRMSDRHAWAEVYVQDIGWVPFDTRPDKVESHAESPVDMQLLQELMGMLGPDEEILPRETLDDPALEPRESEPAVSNSMIVSFILVVLGIVIALRMWTLYAYLLPASPHAKIRRSYSALLARLAALGLTKRATTTKREFERDVSKRVGKEFLTLTEDIEHMLYSKEQKPTDEWLRKLQSDFKTWRSLGLSKELRALVSLKVLR